MIGLGSTVYNLTQVSLRQTITPDRLQGRMNASMRFMVWGTMPIGSLIGGVLGSLIGLQPTLLVGAVGTSLSFLWVLLSPVRALRDQPAAARVDFPHGAICDQLRSTLASRRQPSVPRSFKLASARPPATRA